MLSRLKSFFSIKAAASAPLSSPDVLGLFNVAPSASGVPVDAMTVLRTPAAQQGVRLIADAVATLDVDMFQDGPGGREEVEGRDHPAARLLCRPNPWTGESEFKRQLIQDMLVWGNGLALVVRVRGEPRELHRVDPRACSINIDLLTGELTYTVTMQSGSSRVFGHADMIHLRNLSIDGSRGLGLTSLGSEAIGLAAVMERLAARLFGRGARPAGVLSYDKALSADMLARLRASFDNIFGGAENAGRTLVLENGIKFSAAQLASTDAQFLENRKFQIAEIARLLNVAPVLLGDLEHATMNNATALAQQFLDRTITPILEQFEDALERALLTEAERDAGFEIEFDTTNFTRADIDKRFAAYKSGIESGVLLLNEAREQEGYAPVKGGDVPMRSVQTLPLAQQVVAPADLPKDSADE